MHRNSRFCRNILQINRKLKSLSLEILQQCCSSNLPSINCLPKPSKNLKILFFGSDAFSLQSLQALHLRQANTWKSLCVVTSFNKPNNCIQSYAVQNKLPLIPWPVPPHFCRTFDLGIVVSFGHLIPTRIIKTFPLGMLNVHASLLPRWRGAAPIIHAIKNGDEVTGVTVMRIEPKRFDIGDILDQRLVVVPDNILMPELYAHLAEKGSELLVDVLSNYPESFENMCPQDERYATYAPKITDDMCQIDWSDLTAKEIYNRYRALYGFKNICTTFDNKVVHLHSIRVLTDFNPFRNHLDELSIGSLFYWKAGNCLVVRCANNTYMEVHHLRIEGKKGMSAIEFNNGILKNYKKKDHYFLREKMTN